jgi:hypothetical protein
MDNVDFYCKVVIHYFKKIDFSFMIYVLYYKMHPRVSLLLIALYSTKIFCSLAFITKPPNKKPTVSNNISKTAFIKIPGKFPSDNYTSVCNLNHKDPIMPILHREVIMMFD